MNLHNYYYLSGFTQHNVLLDFRPFCILFSVLFWCSLIHLDPFHVYQDPCHVYLGPFQDYQDPFHVYLDPFHV